MVSPSEMCNKYVHKLAFAYTCNKPLFSWNAFNNCVHIVAVYSLCCSCWVAYTVSFSSPQSFPTTTSSCGPLVPAIIKCNYEPGVFIGLSCCCSPLYGANVIITT